MNLRKIAIAVFVLTLPDILAAAGGPPPTSVEGEVTVKGPVEVQGSVEVLNDALKTVFNKKLTMTPPSGSGPGESVFGFFIPAGKRLVVETVSASARVVAGANATAYLSANAGAAYPNDGVYVAIPLTSQGVFSLGEVFAGTQKVRVVIDPRYQSPNVVIGVAYTNVNGASSLIVTMAGYLEDIPATP